MKQMTKENMLWIFVLAFIMPISLDATCTGGSCETTGDCSCEGTPSSPAPKPNLAQVTWAHAVNSKAYLESTLKNDGIQMIEADVVMGTKLSQPSTQKPEISTPKPETSSMKAEGQKKSDAATRNENPNENESAKDKPIQKPTEQIPIMGHPPSDTSDLSFIEFVNATAFHNAKAKEKVLKGVKLDFKSIQAVQKSLPLIKKVKYNMSPLWINADILCGPGASTTKPVDAKAFFEAVKAEDGLTKATLSIGWTTNMVDNVQYNDSHVDEMLKTIRDNIKSEDDKLHPITFPVRAAIAAQSKDALVKLVTQVEEMNITTTLTIWSAENDEEKLDVKKLQELINHFGVEKVYVDLEDKLKEKLTLASKPNGASSLVNFGLLNVATFLFALFLGNGFW